MAAAREWTAEDAARLFLEHNPWAAAGGEIRRGFEQGVDDGQAGRGSNREEAGTPGLPSSDRQRAYRVGYRYGKATRERNNDEQR